MTVTAPWDARAATAIAAPLRHVYHVRATHPTWDEPVDLDIDPDADPTVTFDEGWAPHVQTSGLTVGIPDRAVLDLLDPRAGVRINVSAGYVYPGGREDVARLADLVLADRSLVRPDATVELVAESDERLVLDNALTLIEDDISELWWPETARCRDVILALLDEALDDPVVDVDPAVPADTIGAELVVRLGDEFWKPITDLADRLDAWVYHDGATWRVRPRPTVLGESAAILRTGPAGTVTAAQDRLSREEWANVVVVRYQDDFWVRMARSGPLAVGTVPPKVLTVDRDRLPAGGGGRAADAILARALSRGHAQTVSALAAYWVRPGKTVTLPDSTRALVARVDFQLARGLMTVTTRHPDEGA